MTPTIRVLAPVWGARYIDMFLDVCVPSMLAPRNLPVLAAEYACEFVFLTKAADEVLIRQHRTFPALAKICRCSFTAIDDVIVPGMEGYSLTRAFGRGIFEVGAKMVDTYFIFMNADFVVSEGAFETLLTHMRQGARAVVAPSLRSIAEETLPILRRLPRDQSQALVVPPRDLVAMALDHLHPTAAANVAGPNISHNAATNQFFWWIDERTLLGHFFLLFMLCIRPERELSEVDGFCDYAFVPEFCPSGNVTILDNSDQCFLLEVQAHDQELRYLQFGACDIADTALHLSSWTTSHHRRYSRQAILMHAGERPVQTDRTVREAAAFMDDLHRRMDREPKPATNHPYWIGARSSAERLTAMRAQGTNASDPWADKGDARPKENFLRRMFRAAIGFPPRVNRFHYDWQDYRQVMPAIDGVLRTPSARILFIASGINPFDQILVDVRSRCQRVEIGDWLSEGAAAQGGPFDFCFIYLSNKQALHAARAVIKAEGAMRAGAPMLAMLHDGSFECVTSSFSASLLQYSRQVMPPGHTLREVRFTGGLMKAVVRDAIVRRADRIAHRGLKRAPGSALGLAGLLIVMFAINTSSAWRKRGPASPHCSSLLLDIRAGLS